MSFRLKFNSPAISQFFIGLMLILPFMFPYHPNPIPTFYMEWLAALFAFLAFIPLLNKNAWPAYQVPAIILLPLAMLGVMALQYAVLDIAYWQHYLLVAQYVVFAALMMLLGTMLKQTIGFDKTMQGIAIALLISGLLSSLVVALDLSNIHLGGWVVKNKGIGAIANIGQQNHLASLLALALASLAYLFVKQRVKAWLAWPLFIILLSSLALTGSRSAWLFVGLTTLSALLYQYVQAKSKQVETNNSSHPLVSHRRVWLFLLLPVLFYVVQIGLPHLPSKKPLQTTNQRMVQLAQTEGSARLNIYKASWAVYTTNPLLGTGFGHMAGVDLNQANLVPQLKSANGQAHNILLQLLAESGIVGAGLFLLLMLAFLWRVRSAPLSPERWLWWLMLGIIGTHAMLEYPLWYIFFLAIAALLLGAGDLRLVDISRYRIQVALALISALWLVSLVQTVHDYRLIHGWLYQNSKVKLNHARFDLMYKQLQPIRAYSPLAVYAENQILLTLPVNRDSLQDKLAATKRLLRAYVAPATAYNYATLLALDGQLDAAKTHLNNVFLRLPAGINHCWDTTVKLTLSGEPSLFPFVKYIEHLRDGEPLDTSAPVRIDNQEFNQSAVQPSVNDNRG